MRKRIARPAPIRDRSKLPDIWLDLEQIATVEVTSEDPNFPIESVFQAGVAPGWRALQEGEQRIRIIFDRPTAVNHIHLVFVETERERTQEFTLGWSATEDGPTNELVRQQWNFSPTGSTNEVEDYHVSLEAVSSLELVIDPDLGRGQTPATLAAFRVA